eukprot:s83_g11.t1
MSRVDVLADDRGLQGCLKAANVQKEWADAFIARHKITTLDDYVYATPHESWEKGVEALVNQVPTLKDNLIALARFRSAFDIGREALRQAAVPSTKQADLDEPLPEATLKSLNQDWERRYNLQLDPSLEPCEAFRSRLYREFRKSQLTVIEARKVKSVITVSQPRTQGSVTLGENLHLEFEKEEGVPIKSCVEYYLQLRVLAHAMAWAGNYQVDYEGSRVWMMDLSAALGYADGQAGHPCEMPGSLALKQALQETHLEWRSPLASPLGGSAGSGSPGAPKRKAAEETPPAGADAAKRPRALKADKFPTVSMVKGGRRLCKPFNDGRGCFTPGYPGRPSAQPGASAALQLRAAKHVAWRGLGDLVQFAWARPMVGNWLVIDLWAGFGGLCLALLAMGLRFHAVAAENDAIPFQVAQQILPQELCRIRDELQALPECRQIPVVTFLENVASMPADVRARFSAHCGGRGCVWLGAAAPFAVARLSRVKSRCVSAWLARSGNRAASRVSLVCFLATKWSTIFAELRVADSIWDEVSCKLRPLTLTKLQAFPAWAQGRGIGVDQLGPTPIRQHRTALFAGLTGERCPGNASKGLADHLLPPGLGKERHLEAACTLPSPFRVRPWPEPDVDFVLHALAVWQHHLAGYSAQCRRVFAQAQPSMRFAAPVP